MSFATRNIFGCRYNISLLKVRYKSRGIYDPRATDRRKGGKYNDNPAGLRGGSFSKSWEIPTDAKDWKYTDRRIDVLKNPTSADIYYYYYYQSRDYARNLFSKHGLKSGIDPSLLWPDENEFEDIAQRLSDERTVEELLSEIRAEDANYADCQRKRNEAIAAKMLEMPKRIEEWRKSKNVLPSKKEETVDLQKRLFRKKVLDAMGGVLDRRDEKAVRKFNLIVAYLEKEDRKKQKQLKQKNKCPQLKQVQCHLLKYFLRSSSPLQQY